VIIQRAAWGARYPDGFGPAPLPAREVWLHHSVTAAPNLVPPFDDDDAAVRTLERIGQQRFGGGISYTFAITPVGRIYQGHGVGRRGAHTAGRNTVGRAICLVGNYEVARPTGAQLDAVVWLLREGRARGWWQSARLDGGHRDAPGAATSCPGRHAHASIGLINQRASRPAEEDDMTPEQARQLAEVHRELTTRLPNRRGARGESIPNGGADTALGYSTNADGFGFRAETVLLPRVLARLDAIGARLDAVEARLGSPASEEGRPEVP
jgi:hypothetical protein